MLSYSRLPEGYVPYTGLGFELQFFYVFFFIVLATFWAIDGLLHSSWRSLELGDAEQLYLKKERHFSWKLKGGRRVLPIDVG
jgi:hypothetical protein